MGAFGMVSKAFPFWEWSRKSSGFPVSCMGQAVSEVKMSEIVLLVVSNVIGGAITWFVSHRYYKRAGEELHTEVENLRREAKELRRFNMIMLHAMEDQKWVKFNRDPAGNIIGRELSATLTE
jgi:hypothetical protein